MAADPLVRFLETRSPSDFATLIEETHQYVIATAYRVVRDYALAEDIAQEVIPKSSARTGEPTRCVRDEASSASTRPTLPSCTCGARRGGVVTKSPGR